MSSENKIESSNGFSKTAIKLPLDTSVKTYEGGMQMQKAEIVSVSQTVGPVKAKVGLGFDTGMKAGANGVGVKFLGTGMQIGKTTSVSLLGSELKFRF